MHKSAEVTLMKNNSLLATTVQRYAMIGIHEMGYAPRRLPFLSNRYDYRGWLVASNCAYEMAGPARIDLETEGQTRLLRDKKRLDIGISKLTRFGDMR